MNKLLSSVSLGLLTLVLYGCGGGNDGTAPKPAAVVPTATTLAATPTTVDAVATVPFTFSAVPSFGTTATTTVTFTNTATTPAFSIASGSNTATGTTTFGSCDFHVTASTFVAPSPLAVGQTIIVNPCNINVDTKGEPAGVAQQRAIALVLGSAASTGTTVTVGVTAGGQLTLNGNAVGTVTLVPVTGA
jgi:hypothetical protein